MTPLEIGLASLGLGVGCAVAARLMDVLEQTEDSCLGCMFYAIAIIMVIQGAGWLISAT